MLRFTDEISDLKEKRSHHGSHTVVGRFIIRLQLFCIKNQSCLRLDKRNVRLYGLIRWRKRIKEVPPYMNSDWSINKETYNADSQRDGTSSVNKL